MKRIIGPGCLKLAVLASGRGSNFMAILDAIKKGKLNARICILISDKDHAPALQKAEAAGIPACFIDPRLYPNKEDYEKEIINKLTAMNIDLVVLAGYMRLVGQVLLDTYPQRIVNIHPALLPSFPGLHAQQQAVDYGVKYSGCTVHLVDEGMDTGTILAQTVVPVYPEDTEDTLAERILIEEHRLYPQVLQWLAEGRIYVEGHRAKVES